MASNRSSMEEQWEGPDSAEREARRLERERRRRQRGLPAYEEGPGRAAATLDEQEATLVLRPGPPTRRRRPPAKTVVRKARGPLSLRFSPPGIHLGLAAYFGHNYVKKYYLDTYLGLLWIPLLPVLDMLMRGLLFGGFLGVPSGNRPYLVFLAVGSIGWYFFDRTTLWGYRSLQYNRRFYRTLPVPWLPAVTGAIVPGAVQAALYALIALAITAYYRLTDGSFYVGLGSHSAYALLGLGLLLLFAWTIGLIFAPLVRVIRDMRVVLRYVFAFWYMLTPILYSIESIPARYQTIARYNPLTAPVELVRHGLLETGLPSERSLVTSLVALGVVAPVALVLFFRAERAAQARL